MRILSLSGSAAAWISAFGGSDLLVRGGLTLQDDGPFTHDGGGGVRSSALYSALEKEDVDLVVIPGSMNERELAPESADVFAFRPATFKQMLDAALELARRAGLIPNAMAWIANREREVAEMRRQAGVRKRSTASKSAVVLTDLTPLRSGGYWCADVLVLAGVRPLLTTRGELPRELAYDDVHAAAPDVVLIPAALKGYSRDAVRMPVRVLTGELLRPRPALYDTVLEIARIVR